MPKTGSTGMSSALVARATRFFAPRRVPVVGLDLPLFKRRGVRVSVQQEYALHPAVSGNKWRKLKYNLLTAAEGAHDRLVTMGGAYSNHLVAVAAAGAELGLATLGYVRGEARLPLNPRLQYCADRGMALHYVSRPDFRRLRSDAAYLAERLTALPGRPYWLPEGGTNALAVRGCTEIWDQWADRPAPDVALVCAGTGGTAAGLIAGAPAGTRGEVVAVLKGDFLQADIARYLPADRATDWSLLTDYHFGGYAKCPPALLDFLIVFRRQSGLPVEPIYTGKLFYGLLDRIERGVYAPGTHLLVVHTGPAPRWCEAAHFTSTR